MHGLQRLVERERDHDALARGQAVGLDHDGSALLADVGQRGLLVGEGAVRRGRDAGARHELLGEALGALELRARGAGPKQGMPASRTASATPATSGVRADDDQPAAGLAGEVRHRGGIGLVQGDVLAELERAAVARGDIELAAARGLGELGGQRVLAAAAAEQQDIDGVLGCAHASSLYTRRPLPGPRTCILIRWAPRRLRAEAPAWSESPYQLRMMVCSRSGPTATKLTLQPASFSM